MIDKYEWQLDFHYRQNCLGENYYKSGRVKTIEKDGDNVTAVVQDGYDFHVKIRLCENKYVDFISCECGEDSCKHMAACLHLLSTEEVPENSKKFREIDEILKNNDMTHFIKKQLKNNYNLYREFKKEFIH